MHYQIPQETSLEDFVEFWSDAYDYVNEPLYTENIRQPLTEERIFKLFVWKSGGKLSERKKKSVKEHYVSKVSDLETISKNIAPEEWLNQFGTGGPIWNIFFLHIWNPKFPIFDQHVFRAMEFIQTGKAIEIPSDKNRKKEIYLNKYRPFYCQLEKKLKNLQPRDLDRALWKFGQFLKWLEPPSEDDPDG